MSLKSNSFNIENHRFQNVSFINSPNQFGNIVPRYVIIHDTGSKTEEGAISWMCNPLSEVSAHLHIARNGNVVQLVDFNKRAYHAGISYYKGESDFNWFSIGIELQNTGSENYTDIQISILISVIRCIVSNYPIFEILGHKEIAPGRKVDPNEFFPMNYIRSFFKYV